MMIHHPSLFSFQPDSNQPENMKYLFSPLNLIGALAVLAMAVGCATTEPGPLSSAATQEESLLTSAGFRIKVATTP
jgi:hypothetical protein